MQKPISNKKFILNGLEDRKEPIKIFGYKIGGSVKIGFSLLDVKDAQIGNESFPATREGIQELLLHLKNYTYDVSAYFMSLGSEQMSPRMLEGNISIIKEQAQVLSQSILAVLGKN